MATPTRGARLLQQLMDADPEVAEKLRAAIDRPAMWRLLKAERLPSLKRALEIEELTGTRVPVAAWNEPEPDSTPAHDTEPPASANVAIDDTGPQSRVPCETCGKSIAKTGTEA